MPDSSRYSSAPPFRALLTIIVGLVLPVVIVAYGASHGWWGTDPRHVRMSARFLAVSFSIVFSWCTVAGFLTHAVWRGSVSRYLPFAVALVAPLGVSILNWNRTGPLLLTVTAAQACGFFVGVWLGAEIWTGQAAHVGTLKNGGKNWPWNLRDSISLALGIPACATLLIPHDSTSIVYVSAAVLCVVTPLSARTWEGSLISLSWCLLSIVWGLPVMAAAGYLGRLIARLTSIFTGARRNADSYRARRSNDVDT